MNPSTSISHLKSFLVAVCVLLSIMTLIQPAQAETFTYDLTADILETAGNTGVNHDAVQVFGATDRNGNLLSTLTLDFLYDGMQAIVDTDNSTLRIVGNMTGSARQIPFAPNGQALVGDEETIIASAAVDFTIQGVIFDQFNSNNNTNIPAIATQSTGSFIDQTGNSHISINMQTEDTSGNTNDLTMFNYNIDMKALDPDTYCPVARDANGNCPGGSPFSDLEGQFGAFYALLGFLSDYQTDVFKMWNVAASGHSGPFFTLGGLNFNEILAGDFHGIATESDPIPEPSSVILLGLAALGLATARKKERRS